MNWIQPVVKNKQTIGVSCTVGRVTFTTNDVAILTKQSQYQDQLANLAVLSTVSQPALSGSWGDSKLLKRTQLCYTTSSTGKCVKAMVCNPKWDHSSILHSMILVQCSVRPVSGSPLLNSNRELVGMACYSFNGFYLYLPSYLIRRIIEARPTKNWIGGVLYKMNVYLSAKYSGGEAPQYGYLVKETTPKGPLDSAGVKPGDVLLDFCLESKLNEPYFNTEDLVWFLPNCASVIANFFGGGSMRIILENLVDSVVTRPGDSLVRKTTYIPFSFELVVDTFILEMVAKSVFPIIGISLYSNVAGTAYFVDQKLITHSYFSSCQVFVRIGGETVEADVEKRKGITVLTVPKLECPSLKWGKRLGEEYRVTTENDRVVLGKNGALFNCRGEIVELLPFEEIPIDSPTFEVNFNF